MDKCVICQLGHLTGDEKSGLRTKALIRGGVGGRCCHTSNETRIVLPRGSQPLANLNSFRKSTEEKQKRNHRLHEKIKHKWKKNSNRDKHRIGWFYVHTVSHYITYVGIHGIHGKSKNERMRKNVRSTNEICILNG